MEKRESLGKIAYVEHVRVSQLVEEDISLLVEMVKMVATGELTYYDADGFRRCPFCGMADLMHDLHCLVVRARQIEGMIEAKLRGVK